MPLRFNKNNQKLLQGDRISGSVGQEVRRMGSEKVRNSKMRLKASKHSLHTNYNASSYYQHFAAFPVDSVQSKKSSGGPKGLIGPPCHGAEAKNEKNFNYRG